MNNKNNSIFNIYAKFFYNSKNNWFLIKQLFLRDFVAQYKQSLIGATWIVIAPLFGIASWLFINYTGILKPGDINVPYPVYVLIGSTIWGFFTSLIISCSQIFKTSSSYILQINFPHEILFTKEMIKEIFTFILSFMVSVSRC